MNYKPYLLSLSLSLLLVACQSQSPLAIHSASTHVQISVREQHLLKTDYADLEKEYSAFHTQALTASYLEKKLRRWRGLNDEAKMYRELNYGRIKHVDTILTILQAPENADLLDYIVNTPELLIEDNPDFLEFIDSLGGNVQGEFQVNTITENYQGQASVAMSDNGSYVVTWRSYDSTIGNHDIYLRHYDSAGQTTGPDVLVNENTLDDQSFPSVAMADDGSYAVTWTRIDPANSASEHDIYVRRYDSTGNTSGPDVLVNSITAGYQTESAISMSGDGSYVVMWNGDGIKARSYDSTGNTNGPEVLVHDTSGSYGFATSVAMADDGDFIVAWYADNLPGISSVYFRRYDSMGIAGGDAVRVNTNTESNQSLPSVAMDSDGDFVVSWDGYETTTGHNIYARRYDSAGNASGLEEIVNANTEGFEYFSSVSMADDGSYAVSWQNIGNPSMYARRFNSDGTARGNDFRVNIFTTADLFGPRLAMNATGEFVAVWDDGNDVLGKRFNSNGTPQ